MTTFGLARRFHSPALPRVVICSNIQPRIFVTALCAYVLGKTFDDGSINISNASGSTGPTLKILLSHFTMTWGVLITTRLHEDLPGYAWMFT